MVDHDIYALANEAIEGGDLGRYASILMSAEARTPLQAAWQQQMADKVAFDKDLFGQIVTSFRIPWEMRDGKQVIPMGPNEYADRGAISESSLDFQRRASGQDTFARWLKQQQERSHNQLKSEMKASRFASDDNLGGYFVPQEYVDTLVANLNMRQVIQRQMVQRIADHIDHEFLYGHYLTAAEATQRVYDDPTEAALDAALGRRMPKLYGGYSESELFQPSPGLTAKGLIDTVAKLREGFEEYRNGVRSRFKGSSLAVLGDGGKVLELEVKEVELEYKVDYQNFEFMGMAPISPMRRVMGQEITGTVVMNRQAALQLMRSMDRNAPMSWIEFNLDLGGKQVRFRGGITEMREKPMSLWGYPVYFMDDRGKATECSPPAEDCEITFTSWRPMTITTEAGLEYQQSQREFMRAREGFWGDGRIGEGPYVKQVDMYANRPAEYTMHDSSRYYDRPQPVGILPEEEVLNLKGLEDDLDWEGDHNM